jgi:hypothetical protein
MDILGMDKVKTIAIGIVTLIVVFFVGFGVGYYKAPVKIATKEVVKEVRVPVVTTATETKTEVQYVEKETPDDSDVEVDTAEPKVTVNGKQYQMEKLPDEINKFDKGKVTVQQGYSIKIDAKDIIPKTPKWGFDIGYSNHGVKTGVEYNFNRNVSTYIEGTPVPVDNKDRYIGAGLRVKF